MMDFSIGIRVLWLVLAFGSVNISTSFVARTSINTPRTRHFSPSIATFQHYPQRQLKDHHQQYPLHLFAAATVSEGDAGYSSAPAATSSKASSKKIGRSLLLFVAFLYGTLNVCLRRVYALPVPPSAPAVSSARGWLASLCFAHLPFQHLMKKRAASTARLKYPLNNPLETATTTSKKPSTRLLWITALDLALWNFLSQGLINIGLLHVSSARASCLIQTSVIWTPFISRLSGHKISLGLWGGVALAFCGLLTLSTNATTAAAGSLFQFHAGDLLVLAGAVSWSFYLFRLGHYSSPENNKHGVDFPAMTLQAIKTFLMAFLYSGWWIVRSVCTHKTTAAVAAASPWYTSPTAWGFLALSAIGPGALADVLQQRGQEKISASEANVILSAEPVFTAICGFLVLGETVARQEMTGGAMILLAALLSSLTG